MNELQKVFNYGSAQVRTVIKNNEPWFVAKDVTEVLEIKNSRDALSRLDIDEKDVALTDTPGGKQEMTIINESGLYSLILGSRKPEAKQFKRWITHEVIPSIRKHGAYMTPETIEKALLNPDVLIDLATRLKDEQQKRAAAEKTIEEQKPLVMFAETCMASSDSILVRELAKLASDEGIKIGEKRLYKKLREWGFILKDRTEPTQRGIEAGYFEVIQRAFQTPYGSKINRTTKVTPKGQVYIIERLKKEGKEAS
ncbi:phage antirepressor [Fictibacillus gelatini]|uniref:phage antirepressor n=1 Tax=Fictibacillus gelatini TaxID=225985 RepID=UPI000401CD66|nr:phage antirepressor [Fictibacillus gelatini]